MTQLGELAMSSGELVLAESCLTRACDLSGLLLMFSSTGSAEGMARLAELAKQKGKHNVAFLALFLLHKTDDCVQVGLDMWTYGVREESVRELNPLEGDERNK